MGRNCGPVDMRNCGPACMIVNLSLTADIESSLSLSSLSLDLRYWILLRVSTSGKLPPLETILFKWVHSPTLKVYCSCTKLLLLQYCFNGMHCSHWSYICCSTEAVLQQYTSGLDCQPIETVLQQYSDSGG
jgi:hypothetical protein